MIFFFLSQFRRLERLRDKLNQFCNDLNLNHLITTTVQQPTTVAAPSAASTSIAPVLSVKRITTKTNVISSSSSYNF